MLPIKPALIDSNLIEFYAISSVGDRDQFNNHSQLLEYIHDRLLSICNSSRGYSFQLLIEFLDSNYVTNLIASLLQMDAIKRCSNLEIGFPFGRREENQLRVEAISNWLIRSANGTENIVKNQKERLLNIGFYGIQNAREMVDHLKTVYCILNYFYLC